jgi:hypothetical protein
VNKKNIKGACREKARLRSALTRIATLTRELSNDLNYASDPATQRYWNESQKRRSQWSIKRKQTESLELIASLPPPYDEQLLNVTKAIWRAAVIDDPLDLGNPAAPLIKRQAELIAQARGGPTSTPRRIAA